MRKYLWYDAPGIPGKHVETSPFTEFRSAVRIFDGPTVERIDDRFEYGEIRRYAIGLVKGLEITVIYTDDEDGLRRLISAWRSEPHERRTYWKKIAEES